MKKIILLILILCQNLNGQAQISKSISIKNAGTLSTVLSRNELKTVTNLKITGEINARDFKTMRDSMPELSAVDISAVTIVAYKGTDGTVGSFTDYPANEIPFNSFFINSYKGNTTLTMITLPD